MNQITNQFGPSCSLEAICNALELVEGVRVGPEEIKNFYKAHDPNYGTQREGMRVTTILDLLENEVSIGGYNVEYWERVYFTTILGRVVGSKAAVNASIMRPDIGCVFALRTHNGLHLDELNRLKITDYAFNGAHAVCGLLKEGNKFPIVRIGGVPCFKLENSWGPGWGEGGFFYLPIIDMEYHVNSVYSIKFQKDV